MEHARNPVVCLKRQGNHAFDEERNLRPNHYPKMIYVEIAQLQLEGRRIPAPDLNYVTNKISNLEN